MEEDGRLEEGKKRLRFTNILRIRDVISYNKEHNIKCPLCGSFYVVKKGLNKKYQRFGCKNCAIRFSVD